MKLFQIIGTMLGCGRFRTMYLLQFILAVLSLSLLLKYAIKNDENTQGNVFKEKEKDLADSHHLNESKLPISLQKGNEVAYNLKQQQIHSIGNELDSTSETLRTVSTVEVVTEDSQLKHLYVTHNIADYEETSAEAEPLREEEEEEDDDDDNDDENDDDDDDDDLLEPISEATYSNAINNKAERPQITSYEKETTKARHVLKLKSDAVLASSEPQRLASMKEKLLHGSRDSSSKTTSQNRLTTPNKSVLTSSTFSQTTATPQCEIGNQYLTPPEMAMYNTDEIKQTFINANPSMASMWKRIKPVNTDEERETVRILLEEFIKICKLFNIADYFIFSGTLLGSYRHLGIQPWDDDVDILMRHADRQRTVEVFKQFVKYQDDDFVVVFLNSRMKLFHRTRSVAINNLPHRWPFLDMSFYFDNETHIWELWESKDHTLKYHVVPKSLIFPLHPRPFEGVWINSPRDAFAVLSMLFADNRCVTLTWVHRKEEAPEGPNMTFDCAVTSSIYPFVHRKTSGACMEESLELNGNVLYTILTEEPVYALTEPYQLKLIQTQSS